MKKGGYQILELKCKKEVNIVNDLASFSDDMFTLIIDETITDDVELFLYNLTENNKTILLKNLLIGSHYLTFYCNIVTPQDNVTYYAINSSVSKGYEVYNTKDDDFFIVKLNDDYILIINLEGNAIIVKLYKGAITQ